MRKATKKAILRDLDRILVTNLEEDSAVFDSFSTLFGPNLVNSSRKVSALYGNEKSGTIVRGNLIEQKKSSTKCSHCKKVQEELPRLQGMSIS